MEQRRRRRTAHGFPGSSSCRLLVHAAHMVPVAGQAALLFPCVDDAVHLSCIGQRDGALVETMGGASIGALRVDGFGRMRLRGCFGRAAASGERHAYDGDGECDACCFSHFVSS